MNEKLSGRIVLKMKFIFELTFEIYRMENIIFENGQTYHYFWIYYRDFSVCIDGLFWGFSIDIMISDNIMQKIKALICIYSDYEYVFILEVINIII